MKRILSVILILILFCTLVGCKSKKQEEEAYAVDDEFENVQTDGTASDAEKNKINDIAAEQAGGEQVVDKSDNTEVEQQPDNVIPEDELQTDAQLGASKTPEVEEEDFTHTIIVDPVIVDYGTLKAVENNYSASDCFVGKIIDSEKVVIDEELYSEYFEPNFSDEYMDDHYFRLNADFTGVLYPLNAQLYIYTVEVEKTMLSVFTEENTKIKVIADVSDMTEEYKVGNRYVMKGTIYQYKGETMLNLKDEFRAKVGDDGSLTGLSRDAKLFETLKTVDDLITNTSVQIAFKKRPDIPTEFFPAYGLARHANIMHEDNKAILERIVSDGKRAIIADSDFKMELKPKEAVK